MAESHPEESTLDERFDFIVVGATPAGGSLACQLVEAGHSVLLLAPDAAAGEALARRHPQHDAADDELPLYPDSEFCHELRDLTGEAAWDEAPLRTAFQRLERLGGRPLSRWVDRWLFLNPARRGFAGWLPTRAVQPPAAGLRGLARDEYFFRADPNDARESGDGRAGAWRIAEPGDRALSAAVEARLAATKQRFPLQLWVRREVWPARVLFAPGSPRDGEPRANGVEYLRVPQRNRGRAWTEVQRHWVRADLGVILCTGPFDAPKLLLLSGIGPADTLAGHRIETVAARPGVGAGLAVAREVVVACDHPGRFDGFGGGPTEDALLIRGRANETDARPTDLWLLRRELPRADGEPRRWSWTIRHAAVPTETGSVRLRSANPLDPPEVALPPAETRGEWDGLIAGVQLLRAIHRRAGVAPESVRFAVGGEPLPVEADTAAIRALVGRHGRTRGAVGTCAIGREFDPRAVLDSRCRVLGVRGLRVIDPAGWPRVPGGFPGLLMLIAAEKIGAEIVTEVQAEAGAGPETAGAELPNPLRALAIRAIGVAALVLTIAATSTGGRRFVVGNWPLLGFLLLVLAVVGVTSRRPGENDGQRA